jgi:DNA-binding Lrp family transcriptional regulator
MKNSVTLDSLDRRILAALQADASLSNAELAERVGSTGPSCWRRIRLLEEAGVLKPPIRLVDPALLGLGVNVLCDVRMRDHAADTVEAFDAFVRDQPQVMECFSITGDWDYLLRIVAADVADYEHFLMRVLLRHASVSNASSRFALSMTKYQTALPVE